MGLKRMCDVTGEALISPVNIGFMVDGQEVKLTVNQKVIQKFVFALAARLEADIFAEVVTETFGKDWDKKDDWTEI